MKRGLGFLIGLLILTVCVASYAAPNKGRVSSATGSGAISHTFTPTNHAEITNIRLHLDGAATQETFTVFINSAKGAAYDTTLYSTAMAGLTNISWVPSGRLLVPAGDVLTVTWTNTDAATWGLEVVYEY